MYIKDAVEYVLYALKKGQAQQGHSIRINTQEFIFLPYFWKNNRNLNPIKAFATLQLFIQGILLCGGGQYFWI